MRVSPAIYEYAARLIGVTPWEASRSKELMIEAHAEAYRRYAHSPILVGIDVYNVEAEAYGAIIPQPAGAGIPSITVHPCSATSDIPELNPLNPAADGRIPLVIKAARALTALLPGANVKIPVSGPFSLASNLVGFENLLCDCITAPDDVAAALSFLVEGQVAFVKAIHAAGIGVTTFESAATPPLLSPEMFRDIALPALKRLLQEAGEILGENISCIIGGNTLPILDYLMETRPGYVICPSETDQNAFMHRMAQWPEVMVRVNMVPGIIARGDPKEIRQEADRVWALAAGRENACIGTGVIPYETDPETVLDLLQYVKQKSRTSSC